MMSTCTMLANAREFFIYTVDTAARAPLLPGDPPRFRDEAKEKEIMIEGLLQPQHLLIILAVALFVFGPKKLPELGQGLGKGIRSFKDSMKAAAEEPEKIDPPVANRPIDPK